MFIFSRPAAAVSNIIDARGLNETNHDSDAALEIRKTQYSVQHNCTGTWKRYVTLRERHTLLRRSCKGPSASRQYSSRQIYENHSH